MIQTNELSIKSNQKDKIFFTFAEEGSSKTTIASCVSPPGEGLIRRDEIFDRKWSKCQYQRLWRLVSSSFECNKRSKTFVFISSWKRSVCGCTWWHGLHSSSQSCKEWEERNVWVVDWFWCWFWSKNKWSKRYLCSGPLWFERMD